MVQIKLFLPLFCALMASAVGVCLHIVANVGGFLTMLGWLISIMVLLFMPPSEERKRFLLLLAASVLEGASFGLVFLLAAEFDSRMLKTIIMGGVILFVSLLAIAVANRLGSSKLNVSTSGPKSSRHSSSTKKERFGWTYPLIAVLLIASGISIMVVFQSQAQHNSPVNRSSSQAIVRACNFTQYPALCLNSLLDFPGALEARESDLVYIALNMTLHRVRAARVRAATHDATAISGINMNRLSRSVYDVCIRLLDKSAYELSNSLSAIMPSVLVPSGTRAWLRSASKEDVLVWLAAARTNLDTCRESLQEAQNRLLSEHMEGHLKDLRELINNSIDIFLGVSWNKDFTGIPT